MRSGFLLKGDGAHGACSVQEPMVEDGAFSVQEPMADTGVAPGAAAVNRRKLIPLWRRGRKVLVGPVAPLRQAVDEHPALRWDPRIAEACGKLGEVLADDSDGTSQVRFDSGYDIWMPTCLLYPFPAVRLEPLFEIEEDLSVF